MAEARIRIVVLACLVGLVAMLAAGCGSSSSGSSAPSTTTTNGGANGQTANAAFRSCLAAHGVTAPSGRPTPGQGGLSQLTSKQRQAFTACRGTLPARGSGAPRGQSNPAFAKYTQCLKQHGVTFGSTSNTSATFAKAASACAKYRPTNGSAPAAGS
ncbi:MAG TPA: hypothetical protein VGF66_04650 [Gaiellaceae bacterium]|jgi:hypothetical protein